MKKELLEYSFKNKLSHIPSALSMLDYVEVLFENYFVVPEDKIVIGKPFGSQAYYLVWQKLNYLNSIEKLSVGVKHEEIDFVDYGEESMGNALGVACGIALSDPVKKVWVNLSDASLQMGNILEAIQFIGHHNLKNIFVTVDYNNTQVTGKIGDILRIDPVINFCKNYDWSVHIVDGHDKEKLRNSFSNMSTINPNIFFCFTKKGNGIKVMEDNVKEWHYKTIESENQLNFLLKDEKNFT